MSNFRNDESFNLETIKESVKNKISTKRGFSKKNISIDTEYRLSQRRQSQKKSQIKPQKSKRNSLATHHTAKKVNKSRIDHHDGAYSQKLCDRIDNPDKLNLSSYPQQYERNESNFGGMNKSFDMPFDNPEIPPMNITELDLDTNSLESPKDSHTKYPKIRNTCRDLNTVQKKYPPESKTKAKIKNHLNRSLANSPSSLNPSVNLKGDFTDNSNSIAPTQTNLMERKKRKSKNLRATQAITHLESPQEIPSSNNLPSVVVSIKNESGTGSALFDANYEPCQPALDGYDSEDVDQYESDHFEG